ncbi:hypothetical protein ASD65_02640 [Microbacterium sp. Root61]|uniref:serine hydrolase domain-containing protein n=1 Tax=Microbacterium sp. Root61 TaxID=1736570 RepID=UPI0006FA2D9A|nr:serine hydrolase domain-containing protein [Microbacterium sp. Root61]KRA23434.1 hypothetical protein ASD65_02640 [Microbacterium sp. Root61]
MIDLQKFLDSGIARNGVPGAALAVLTPNGVEVAVAGVINARTGVPVQEDTLFQIGSITKVWTSTIAMQLAAEGLLDIDQPIVEIDPSLAVGGAPGAAITMRHLLSHTSGLECDLLLDTGRGDDVLERYVEQVRDEPLMHEPGELWSYCNTGFIIAGRALELVSGKTWDQLVQERIISPLGLERSGTLPEQALLHSAAVGHVHALGEPYRPADAWFFPRAVGPAGSVFTSVRDLAAFGRLHLAPSDVLAEEGLVAMRTEVIASEELVPGLTGWGIGWGRFQWGEDTVYIHTGGTIGQYAFVVVHPGSGSVIALLTNGGNADALSSEVYNAIAPELFGLQPAGPRAPGVTPAVDAPFGEYLRYGSSIVLRTGADGPEVELIEGEVETGDGEHRATFPLLTDADGTLTVIPPGSPGATLLLPFTLRNGKSAILVGTRLYVAAAA